MNKKQIVVTGFVIVSGVIVAFIDSYFHFIPSHGEINSPFNKYFLLIPIPYLLVGGYFCIFKTKSVQQLEDWYLKGGLDLFPEYRKSRTYPIVIRFIGIVGILMAILFSVILFAT